MTESATRPDSILKELSNLWVSLGEQQANGEAAAVRACAMTLIVVSDDEDDPQVLGESLAELMRHIPSRTIILRLLRTAGAPLESRVVAQCWMPFGRRQQICCEQVELTTGLDRLAQTPPLLLPLLVPDLPVVLWIRASQVLDQPASAEILHLAGTVVIDSATLGPAPGSLRRVATLQRSVRRIADLSWTRLTSLRETIAQLFENPHYCNRLCDITEVEVRHPGGDTSAAARYLAAWLAASLPRTRTSISAGSPFSVSFEGPSMTMSLLHAGDGSLELRANSNVTHLLVAPQQDAALLAEELSILGHDPQFEAALARASD
jgi:glucose-6-phosphate dehydrogenase assembly protein OpcA